MGRSREEWERFSALISIVASLFRKDPLPLDTFNPYAKRNRQPAKKPKPLNPRLSLDLLGAAVIKEA